MSATGARWERVNELFHAAVARVPAERASYLETECASDPSLRQEVESLLSAHRASDGEMAEALRPGSRIGDYEISGFIAAGAMGQVYRARDTRLGRDAALKVLPPAFVADPDRRTRFEREARTLASLTHPHIATIYGFEEEGGVSALALELVDGETLADRIARGRLPVDEALRIARQIAEALEVAHERGIVHRDLKPANVKITRDGVVKVLDFGLAKLAESAGSGQRAAGSSMTAAPGATGMGMLVGTPAYMSPEQARGEEVDQRSDIWAFGCVLFEMLTGQRAFAGDTVTDTIASVLAREPNLEALPKELPGGARTLVVRCLSKDRIQRVPHASVVRFLLNEPVTERVESWRSWTLSLLQNRTSRVVVILAIIFLGTAAERTVRYLTSARSVQPQAAVDPAVAARAGLEVAREAAGLSARPVRFAITFSPQSMLSTISDDHHVAITPDGSSLVYVGNNRTELFVRALDQIEPRLLVTDRAARGPRGPFVSIDGKWVGFFAGNAIHKIALTGGAPVLLCDVDSNPRGAAWTGDGTIVFATDNPASGLFVVSANGGEPRTLTKPDHSKGERDHIWPRAIPGTSVVLFTVLPIDGGIDHSRIAAVDLNSGVQKTLIDGGSDAQYVSGGFLVYAQAGTLRAVAFDRNRLEVTGSSVPVGPEILTTTYAAADFDISTDGTLAYVSDAGVGGAARTLSWADRTGHEQPINAPLRAYQYVRISPDGTHVALDIRDQEQDIWTWDFRRETLTRLTSDPGSDRNPVWSGDGSHIAFSSTRTGERDVYWQAADGTGSAERLLKSPLEKDPRAFSPDGKFLLLREISPSTGYDLLMMSLFGDHNVVPLVAGRFAEENAAISPDGRWLAYESDESGTNEVYVRPFPDINGGRWQVSSGGSHPVWSRDGRELFYIALPSRIMSVPVRAGPTFSPGKASLVFAGAFLRTGGPPSYDVSLDGKRFLIIKDGITSSDSSSAPRLIVVQRWTEELKRQLPLTQDGRR